MIINLTLRFIFLLNLIGLSSQLIAQTFPSKPIKIIVPVAVGGGADRMTRTMAAALSERIGQPVVIENRGGAGGTVGMDLGAKAEPDGHTLTMVFQSMGVNPYLYLKLPFDTVKDFSPVSLMVKYQVVMVVNNSLPVKNVAELVGLAKAKPDSLSFGGSGMGGLSHLSMELFMNQTGTKFLHIPYKGNAPAMADLLGGQINVIVDALAGVAPLIKDGKIKALGVGSKNRSSLLPNVPAIAETYPSYEMVGWLGIAAPSGTPPDRVNYLSREIAAAMNQPSVKEVLVQTGNEIVGSTPEEFGRYIRSELDKYEALSRAIRMKPNQ